MLNRGEGGEAPGRKPPPSEKIHPARTPRETVCVLRRGRVASWWDEGG